jgi:lipopolysaccharide transport system ATP-binding protein
LDNVSFEVKQGEVLGIIGRNGAGKSTLLKILSQVTTPTSGQIKIKGRIASLLEVGTGFNPEMTGRENVFLNGAILGMTKAEIRKNFDEIVAFSGVEEFIDTPVKRYSSGMYVRLAFAVAAHLEPEILIVDEVLAVGDAEFQKKCLGKMQDVAKIGRTVIFVSHSISSVQELCSHGICLNSGKTVASGKAYDVINYYLKQIAPDSSVHLKDRRDRQGAGNALFTNIEILDFEDNPIGLCRAGMDVKVRLHFDVKSEVALLNCRMSVSFHAGGNPFILLSTEMTKREYFTVAKSGFLDFKIPKLPLGRGSYSLSPFIESSAGIEDLVEAALTVDIKDGNFYGLNRDYPNGWEGKTVMTPHSWELGHA